MLNQRDSTALSLLEHTGKSHFLVSSIVLIATSSQKNVHCYSRKKENLLISIFMALPQSSKNSNLQHSHILTVFSYIFSHYTNFTHSNKLTFLYLKGKLIASNFDLCQGREWTVLESQTFILKCSGYHSFLFTDLTGKFTASWRSWGKNYTPSETTVLIDTGLKLLFSRVRRYHFHWEVLQNKQENPNTTHNPLFQGVKLCCTNNRQERIRLLSAVYSKHCKVNPQSLAQAFLWSCLL